MVGSRWEVVGGVRRGARWLRRVRRAWTQRYFFMTKENKELPPVPQWAVGVVIAGLALVVLLIVVVYLTR